MRQDSREEIWNKYRNTKYFSYSQKTKFFSVRGKKSWKKENLEGECWLYIFPRLWLCCQKGQTYLGKNCWDRAWQLNLFPVFLISWFTYSRSVFTATAPPHMLWFGKSYLTTKKKNLQIKDSRIRKHLKSAQSKALLSSRQHWWAQWNQDQSMHLTICQPSFLASD